MEESINLSEIIQEVFEQQDAMNIKEPEVQPAPFNPAEVSEAQQMSTKTKVEVVTEKKKTKKKKKHSELPKEADNKHEGGDTAQPAQENDAYCNPPPKTKKKKKVKENKDDENKEKENDNSNVTQQENKKKKKEAKKEEKKEEKSKIKGKDADSDQQIIVLDYMVSQNRPYSLLNIFDNLHGSIKKKQLERILDALTEDKEIICREYNSKIYLASQHHFSEIDPEESQKLDEEIDKSREKIGKLKEKSGALQNELKLVNSSLTDEELEKKIQILTSELSVLTLSLNSWKEGKIEKIPDDKILAADKEHERVKNLYKKTKKACNGIIDYLCEGMEMKKEEILKHISNFESEADLFANLKIKNF